MPEVVLFNPNMIFPSETSISGRTVSIRDIEKVINLGLLSIASYLESKKISLKIVDLVGKKNDIELVRNTISSEQPKVVGMSCISCFSYQKVIEYAKLIKSLNKNVFIMVGGQHISNIARIVMSDVPEIDCVVKGEGEYLAYQIISCLKEQKSFEKIPSILFREHGKIVDNTTITSEKVDLDSLPYLKYDIYPDFKEFSPHVEESRWCPFGCNFCTSKSMSNGEGIRYKSISRLVDEIVYVKSLYGSDIKDLKFFIACSTFGVKRSRVEEFIRLMREKQVNILWRTETRSDAPMVDYFDQLVDVGLRVIDLGLETGSPTMLKLMNKCKNTDEYLMKARHFFKTVGATKNLQLKVNLLFYAGESPDTIRETIGFLMENSAPIASMSAGPVVLYHGTTLEEQFFYYAVEYGSTLIRDDFWNKVHAYPVNPSMQFSFDHLNIIALAICKMFCREKEYFEVKKFGQLPLNMTYEDFHKTVKTQEPHLLPFNF